MTCDVYHSAAVVCDIGLHSSFKKEPCVPDEPSLSAAVYAPNTTPACRSGCSTAEPH